MRDARAAAATTFQRPVADGGRRRATGGVAGDIAVAGDAIVIDGTVTAVGGGAIRLDYYTAAPVITGSVQPSPIVNLVAPSGCP